MTGVPGTTGRHRRRRPRRWFAEPLAGLHDPVSCPTRTGSSTGSRGPATRGERVMVFGDFDADGLDGLAILVIALRRFGVDVEPYVPSRLEEGHGLSIAAIDTAVAGGRAVIVTVDCGTSPGPEIAAAQARGIDVLVTDHHRVPPELPPAWRSSTRIAPTRSYPDPRLAGSGVAFKVAQLLLAAAGWPGAAWTWPTSRRSAPSPMSPRSSGRIAPSLGSGSNACGSTRGPASRPCSSGPGSRRPPSTSRSIAFALAPRLNAAGRVGEALEAARLLLAETPEEAAGTPMRWRPRIRPGATSRRPPSPRPASSWPPRPTVPRRSSAARGRSASSGSSRLGSPRTVLAPPWSARRSATRSGRHAVATARSIWRPRSPTAPTCSRGTADTQAPPASSCRPPLARVRRAVRGDRLGPCAAGPADRARDRSRHPRARRRLPAVPRSRRAPAVRSGQPRAASRGPRSDRHPRAVAAEITPRSP